MELDTQFSEAGERIKTLTERPSNEELLQLYAFFKQGTEGDVNGPKPGMFDFKGAAKYQYWEKLKGMASEEAKQGYVNLVNELLAKYPHS